LIAGIGFSITLLSRVVVVILQIGRQLVGSCGRGETTLFLKRIFNNQITLS